MIVLALVVAGVRCAIVVAGVMGLANLTTVALASTLSIQRAPLPDGNLWPSNHTTAVAAAGMALLLIFRGRWRWPAWLLAYGSSKAAADAFARGLRDSLEGPGVDVLIVRPGFVRTKMTEGMDPAPGAVDAPAVTAAVLEGLRGRGGIVYVPGFLRWVMLVIKLMPRPVFRRLPL